ncbi:hypothetical protein [Hyphomicrobium sp. LHD-15]|uniref:hypothetical protein n=1 Tax=Hyphomicrobium sp. LHD-15 TaxID=3072142 RepID=UPI00280C6A2A|nr:hypothetical protein [Hyphomicrobium sp. LHD-15]MDQ8697931.1 hypothetical protein [Hyphomicrobium sp. LHD-15]
MTMLLAKPAEGRFGVFAVVWKYKARARSKFLNANFQTQELDERTFSNMAAK